MCTIEFWETHGSKILSRTIYHRDLELTSVVWISFVCQLYKGSKVESTLGTFALKMVGGGGGQHKAVCKQAWTSCIDQFSQGKTVCWGGKNVGFKFWLSWVWILILLPEWPGASWELRGCRMQSIKWLNYPSPWFSVLAILQNHFKKLRHFKKMQVPGLCPQRSRFNLTVVGPWQSIISKFPRGFLPLCSQDLDPLNFLLRMMVR